MDPGEPEQYRRRVSLRPGHARYERRHRRRQRHADRPLRWPDGLRTTLGNAGTFPILRDQLDHQFVYNLSWLSGGNHVFKAGMDIRRQQLDDFADSNSRGLWNFDRTCAGVTYASCRWDALRCASGCPGTATFLVFA